MYTALTQRINSLHWTRLLWLIPVIHWGQHKTADILPMVSSNAVARKINSIHWLQFRLSMFLRDTSIMSQHSLRPRQSGRYFADDTFKCISLNENLWISFTVSPKFVSKVPTNNIAALIQIMAWCQPDDKPLSEPMIVRSLTHICVTRPKWINGLTSNRRQAIACTKDDTGIWLHVASLSHHELTHISFKKAVAYKLWIISSFL